MNYFARIFNERGSIRHGLVLLLVMIVIITIFYFIDQEEQETRDFGYSRDPDRFDESRDSPFFNDDDFIGTSRSQQAHQPILKSLEEIEEDMKKEEEKTPTNTFYKPASPEQSRAKQSTQSGPRLRP